MRWVRALALLLIACSDVDSASLAINDPLDLIDDVEGPLRLFVLPSDGYSCDETTGAVTPAVPDVPEGMVGDAIADLSLDVQSSMASAQIDLEAGTYTVLVRGKGTDPVTMIPDVFIATGCRDEVAITAGETLDLTITLIPIVGMGECGDGTQSPDEQCEDGNTTNGDGCSNECRTERFDVSTTGSGDLEHPRIGGAVGQRWTISYDFNPDTLIRILEADGGVVSSPSVLMMDGLLRDTIGGLAGQHLSSSSAVASNGRMGISFTHFSGTNANVRVAFFDQNRNAEGATSVLLRGGLAIASQTSSIAFAGDGAAMIVFEDAMSATGISGQIFASGSMTPIAADPFAVGAAGGVDPVVSGASDHFVVAYAAGGDVFIQRFDTTGTPRDAAPVAVLENAAGTQDQPSVAVLSDGRALVAWRDTEGDGAGTSIRARAFTATAAAGEPFVVETTTAGDQSLPSVAGSAGTFGVVWQSGSSVRMRVLTADGTPLPNHEQPPTTADFEVGNGSEPQIAAGGPSAAPIFLVVWNDTGSIRGRTFPLP